MLLFMGQLKGKNNCTIFCINACTYSMGICSFIFRKSFLKTKYWDYSDHKINFSRKNLLDKFYIFGVY